MDARIWFISKLEVCKFFNTKEYGVAHILATLVSQLASHMIVFYTVMHKKESFMVINVFHF